jgi:predicted RNA-binding protein (TIGR00451 family)
MPLRIYNMSKSSRDELFERLADLPKTRPLKSKDLKKAEGEDSSFFVVFDSKEKVYLGAIDGKKANQKGGGDSVKYFPTLRDEWILPACPIVTIDSGAIKFVVNGANIMRPGITKIEGQFAASAIVTVKEEKHGKAIAVGVANLSSEEMSQAQKGSVVENLHHVGDKFWEMLKEIP